MGLEFTQSEDYVLPLYLSLAEIYDLGSVFLEDKSFKKTESKSYIFCRGFTFRCSVNKNMEILNDFTIGLPT